MALRLSRQDWINIFPSAPSTIIDAFVTHVSVMEKAGIMDSQIRIAYCLANVEHECGGFTIKNLTENINYSAKRMAEVWPNRFNSANDVVAKYGSASGWQLKAFDDIYGGRMGNRKNTNDGSRYIGRGAPQITGRGGYREIGKITGLNLVDSPELATVHDNQPAIIAAFVQWKGLNSVADTGDFKGYVKIWNGGLNGYADRKEKLKGNEPILSRLSHVATITPKLKNLK